MGGDQEWMGGKEARSMSQLAREYEVAGESKGRKMTCEASLRRDWRGGNGTQEGDSTPRQDDGDIQAPLPKKAWENLSERRRETEERKR